MKKDPKTWSISQKIKNFIIYYFSVAGLWFIGHINIKIAYFLASICGAVFYFFAKYERNVAIKNLKKCIEANSINSDNILKTAKKSFQNLAMALVDLASVYYKKDKINSLISDGVENLEKIKSLLSRGKGVIFVTGHIGNWELMAAFLGLNGINVKVIGRQSYDSRFTSLIEKWRKSFNVETIWRENKNNYRKISQSLKQGNVLGILIDQDTDVPGVFVKFLGFDAWTPVGAAKISLHTRAPVVTGYLIRLHSLKYQFILKDISDYTINCQDDLKITSNFNYEVSLIIKENPEQWVWMHERWKTQAKNEQLAQIS